MQPRINPAKNHRPTSNPLILLIKIMPLKAHCEKIMFDFILVVEVLDDRGFGGGHSHDAVGELFYEETGFGVLAAKHELDSVSIVELGGGGGERGGGESRRRVRLST